MKGKWKSFDIRSIILESGFGLKKSREKEGTALAWYEEAVFYHIYPLGLAGAPEQNDYGEPVHRLRNLKPWVDHMKACHFTGLYIGPLFESVGHGYETTDYRKVDTRLGTNEDLKEFVAYCHEAGIRVVLDGVFNHTGRDFFAFRDLKERREQSPYRDWYCGVNFWGNNEYGDGFSYENWGGYNLLAKLNLKNPQVRDYLFESVRFWVEEFDIDGLRLDAADVLDFDFMRGLRGLTESLKPDFWLMGEVIHGDYGRWVNERTLHSVTNYHLHKALYSGHNDHNYFEIAHTVRRQREMGLGREVHLYSFADNHDVERIHTKLREKMHFFPVHVLLYTLPGIPSVYYGSEFGIDGRKERGSDASLRPCLNLEELLSKKNPCLDLIRALGEIHSKEPALSYGEYRELALTTTVYAFARGDILVTVTNAEAGTSVRVPGQGSYRGALSGAEVAAENGSVVLPVGGNSGEIWIPQTPDRPVYEPVKISIPAQKKEEKAWEPVRAASKPYDEMTVEELQAEILAKMAANGPVTDRMRQDVRENVYRNSLLNWVRSFR